MSTRMGLASNFAVRFTTTIAIAFLAVVANANISQTKETGFQESSEPQTPIHQEETLEENRSEPNSDDDKQQPGHSDAERMGEILESLEHDKNNS